MATRMGQAARSQLHLTRSLASQVLPAMLGMLAVSCYIMADTWFIAAALGNTGLASLNIAIPFFSFMEGLSLMLGMSCGTALSLNLAGGKRLEAQRSLYSSLVLAALLTVGQMLLGLWMPEGLLRLLGADAVTLSGARVYARTLCLFAPAFVLNELLAACLRNQNRPKRAMAGMLTASASNIVLDYVFLFPLGLGMFGAALATGLASALACLLQLGPFLRRELLEARGPLLSPRELWRQVSLGQASLVIEWANGIVLVVFNILVLRAGGRVALAAYGIVTNVSIVLIALFTGGSRGAQAVLSQAYGRGQTEQLRHYLRQLLLFFAMLSLLALVLVYVWTGGLVALFNREDNVELGNLAAEGLRLYLLHLPFSALNIVLAQALAACARPAPGRHIALLRALVLLLPLALVLAQLFGLRGIWLSVPICELLVAAYALVAWRRNLAQPLRAEL